MKSLATSPMVLLLSAFAAGLTSPASGQTYDTNNPVVYTFAGSGFYGHVDGQGFFTMFHDPSQVVADSTGNLFVLDKANNVIRKITPDATVSTYFHLPGQTYTAMTIDRANALWILAQNSLVRITPDRTSSVVPLTVSGYSPYSAGLCVDSGNNLYISDSYGNRIYRFSTNGVLEVFAGSGNPGAVDGNWIFSSFLSPGVLAIDAADTIYVWDSGNRLIRAVNQNRDVFTVAGRKPGYYYSVDEDGTGTNASFAAIHAMRMDGAGNLLLACGTSVRKMTPAAQVVTIAGVFNEAAYANGPGADARFKNTSGICVIEGHIYVTDSIDHRVRKITMNPSDQPVTESSLALNTYAGINISGMVGRAYRIESSTDTIVWSNEATLLLKASPHLWIDPACVGQKKFYRAVLLP